MNGNNILILITIIGIYEGGTIDLYKKTLYKGGFKGTVGSFSRFL